ncbi:MAG: hypothetical protein ABSG13_28395 [Bryobacteraceae bacterium]
MIFVIARVSALTCVGLCLGQAATLRDSRIASPTAIATDAAVSYCFARVRGLDPERLPPAYLVLRLRVTVSYRNSGARAMILPLERERIIYSALKPGQMSVYKEGLGLFDQSFKAMKELPPEVSPDSPITPKNDVFTVIPAGGEMTPPLMEEITMPVSAKGLFKRTPDLRGKRVYVKLRYVHRELTPALQSNLSDRWSRFGEPWTGTVTTNTIMIDVPAAPGGDPCVDAQTPAHPVVGDDDKK